MKNLLKEISNFSARAVYLIYICLSGVLLFNYVTDTTKHDYIYLLVNFLLLCLIGPLILIKVSSHIEIFNEKRTFFALLLLCFFVKFIWVYLYTIEPRSDYATFYKTAKELSNSWVIHNRYLALFPHIMGYASFLSIFFRIFGASQSIPPLINVVLSVISMTLIYLICKKIGGIRAAIIASILWILFPSQTIYNMLVLSDPYYSTLLLMIWYIIIVFYENLHTIKIKKLLSYAVVLGLLLTLMNMSRPIALIPIIALAIWLFLIDIGHINNKKILQKKALYLLSVFIAYYVLSLGANHYITLRLGEEIAKIPGFNVYVGFNMKSSGGWNRADSALLTHYNEQEGWSANDVQKQMLEEAKERIFSGQIDFSRLFYKKFLYLLEDDSAVVTIYTATILGHAGRYFIITNVFYYFLLAASLFGAAIALIKKNKSPQFFILLYFIGLTMAHMFVEVAARYHYSATISMVIFASLGISFFSKKAKVSKN